MKLFYTFILILLFSLTNIYSQDLSIDWQYLIGGDNDDFLKSVAQTSDGGYILGGYSSSNISADKNENSFGSKDYWVIKLNEMGVIEWQKTIGGNGLDELYSISQTTDGGYILGGYSNSDISGNKTENSNGGFDYWVIKLNDLGVIEWQNTIGSNQDDFLYSVIQTSDGGYILGGYSNSINISGDKDEGSNGLGDYWVIKLTDLGVIEWQKTIGGSGFDSLLSTVVTTDDGYILGGYSLSNISGDKTENLNGGSDYWVIKLNNLGDIEWQNTIGGNGNDVLLSLSTTTDGGYILGGFSDSDISGDKTENSLGGIDFWVIKLDNSGTIEWQNTIGGNKADELDSVIQTNDGGYMLGGISLSNISGDKTEDSEGRDIWIVKLNSSGAIISQNTIGGNSFDTLSSIYQTNDSGFILGASSKSGISGDKTEDSNNNSKDYWLIKILPSTLSIKDETLSNSITLYPNPSSNIIYIKGGTPDISISIYDVLGKEVIMEKATNQVDISTLKKGIYFVKISDGIKISTNKLVKN